MAWVQWDDAKGFQGIVRQLPPELVDRGPAHLQLLGYRELVVREPDNFIRRFAGLLGTSEFALLPDGRVEQTFPNADFSVKAVRTELGRLAREAAHRELSKTDWQVIRALEKAAPMPADTVEFRNRIRAHVDWITEDIAKKSPRELVDYDWLFPQTPDQKMVNGVPVKLNEIAPVQPPPLPEPPAEVHTGVGFDTDADGVIGNADPSIVDPAPPPPPAPVQPTPPDTTDGPVPVVPSDDPEHHPALLDAEGFPLVTAYAPNVEDTGPLPAND